MQTARTTAFKITPAIRQEMVKIIDARIREAHVTKEDFSELKSIVKDLAVAQKRTEIKVEELVEAQKELVEAQKRTELAITRLSGNIDALTQKVGELSLKADRVDTKLGGLDKSIGLAFENEAYRHLPEVLKNRYGIEIKEQIIRTRIGGREIDLLGHAIREGREVLVVGEAKTKLDERKEIPEVFAELEGKVQAVLTTYPQAEIVRVLVAHFAIESLIDKANARGIIVVQGFEW